MDPWAAVRREAEGCRERAERAGGRGAQGLLAAALSEASVELREFTPGEPGFAPGLRGRFERAAMLIYVSRCLGDDERAFVIAHELGHLHLHEDPILEDAAEAEANDPSRRALSGYSAREVKERQADAFASEFLCPSQRLRDLMRDGPSRASAMASALGAPVPLVLRQVAAALLRPPGGAGPPEPRPEPALDAEQRRCALWADGCLLVTGRPGSGKTTALRARLRHLIEGGAGPGTILALVRSEQAAEGLREALAVHRLPAARQPWIGTLLGLGLEIASKWPGAIPRSPEFRVLDATGPGACSRGAWAACDGSAACPRRRSGR